MVYLRYFFSRLLFAFFFQSSQVGELLDQTPIVMHLTAFHRNSMAIFAFAHPTSSIDEIIDEF